MTAPPMFSLGARHIVFVSPHLDDAALSCGATIWSLGRAGRSCEVVTLFGGRNTGPLSPLARCFHEECGLAFDGTDQRRAEDRQAMDVLAVPTDPWNLRDAIYRTDVDRAPLYASRAALFRAPHPGDDALVDRLIGALSGAPAMARADALVVPLAIGDHVDHVIARRCIEALARAHPGRARLIYYEDLPYACTVARGEVETHVPAGFVPALARLSVEAFDAKERAVRCYRSQIAMLWPSRGPGVRQLRDHAASLEPGSLCERFWVDAAQPPAHTGSPEATVR